MDYLKVAIVGCGRISELHELGYRDCQNAKITAVCDKSRTLAEQKARMWNIPASGIYTDYGKLLSSPDIDLVELLVPHHLHAPMAVAACNAGKHVSVQKPMAVTLDEADQMINAANRNGVYFRVYENFMFYPPLVKVKSMIDNGVIGEPQILRMHFNNGTLDSSWKVPLKAWMWRFDEKKCGGGPLVFDHGYHLFSIAHYLMGPVEKVSAWIDKSPLVISKNVDGPATVMMKFTNQRRYGVIDFAYTPQMRINSNYYADDNIFEIIGEKGIIFVNRCTTRTVSLPTILLFKDGLTSEIEISRSDWKYSFIDATRHFVDAITFKTRPMLDGPAAREILKTALATQYSSIEKREFDVEETAFYAQTIRC